MVKNDRKKRSNEEVMMEMLGGYNWVSDEAEISERGVPGERDKGRVLGRRSQVVQIPRVQVPASRMRRMGYWAMGLGAAAVVCGVLYHAVPAIKEKVDSTYERGRRSFIKADAPSDDELWTNRLVNLVTKKWMVSSLPWDMNRAKIRGLVSKAFHDKNFPRESRIDYTFFTDSGYKVTFEGMDIPESLCTPGGKPLYDLGVRKGVSPGQYRIRIDDPVNFVLVNK